MALEQKIPAWMAFPYIETGDRTNVHTYKDAMKSLFSVHNETVNAWTMIFSSVVAAALFIHTLNVSKDINTGTNVFPYAIFFLAPLMHLPFSVGYHLFIPISQNIKELWRKLDFAFVFLGGTMFAYAIGYFVLGDYNIYLCFAALLLSIFAIGYINYKKGYGTASERTKVTVMIGCLVLLYIAPMYIQAIFKRDVVALGFALSVTAILGLSAWCYAESIPERFVNKGACTFDMVGNSHNIMHIGILVAYVLEYMFIRHAQNTNTN